MMRSVLAGATAAALVCGCAMLNPQGDDPAHSNYGPMTAEAELLDVRRVGLARAVASQAGDSIRIRVDANGLPAGVYGAHIHGTGRCDLPDFASAGPHWNPSGQQHGRDNPQGMHLGDLPNLMVGADGKGTLEINIARGSISSGGAALLDQDGSAIVIHERPDDYRTDPSGNSGARIACGVFR